MGCCHSRLEGKEAISRCKARRRYMRQLSEGRQAFAAAHSLYLHFLRRTGAALLQFSNAEAPLTASSILPPPPPPPPEWEEAATTISEITASPSSIPPPTTVGEFAKDSAVELLVVAVPRGKKDIPEIVKELDVYFVKASDAGTRVSVVLEAPNCSSASLSHGFTGKIFAGKMSSYCKSWSISSSPKASGLASFSKSGEEMSRVSHSCTIEKLYAWEKKLFLEVKNCELTRVEKEKRLNLLRRQEANGADYFKVEKNKREIERLESKLMVSCQAIETTSIEIVRLREAELFPQLLNLINGLMCMWRVMYECHQVQTHIVQQLSYLNSPSTTTSPTSDLHQQATLQLESEIENWHSAFCSLIKSQRDYIHALAGWLRLSLFQCPHNQLEKNRLNSEIFALCEEWQLALDRVPDKVASEGIKSFLNVIHAVVVQQADEHRQKKRSDSAFKELEKRSKELRSLENRYGPYSSKEKKAKVDALKMKAEEEKNKYEKSSGITRVMTLNNLQTGFPNLFQAMTGFSSVFVQAYSSVYNHRMSSASPLTSIEF
ncbi:hypothetical protein KSP40_PGU013371 [Platanthera guangdongensis]|uniref:DUF632 domain-containing protein n=1 Tax=Platanthera guangdongensis TaxID=2320717 RepID=A0ABR2MQD3_9ASPA